MRCRLALILAVGVVLSVVGKAWAFPPSNPYLLSPGGNPPQFIDRTQDFQGGQASSMIVTPLANQGLQLDITWSTGAPFTNPTNTKVVPVWRFPSDNGDGDGGDLNAFDGVLWKVQQTGQAATIKPFTQVYGTFTFYEGTQAAPGGAGTFQLPLDNSVNPVSIDWNMVNNGGSIPLGNTGRDNVFETGWQIFGPDLPQDGSTAHTTIILTNPNVPEPASLVLAFIGGLSLVGMAGRKLRK